MCDNKARNSKPKRERGVSTKAKITKEALLIPKEVAERALGQGSEEVEIFEEPGRLVVATVGKAGERESSGIVPEEDPILGLGKNPVRTGARMTDRMATSCLPGRTSEPVGARLQKA